MSWEKLERDGLALSIVDHGQGVPAAER